MTVGEPAPTPVGELLSRVRGLAKGRDTIDVAQLHFVDLDKIAQAYGVRWKEHKSRIQDAAESFLRKRIGLSDLLVRGEGGFLIVLGAAAGPEAHAVTAQLTHALNAFFTGDMREITPPRFGGTVQSVPAKELERSLGRGGASAVGRPESSAATSYALDIEWKFEPVWDVRRETLSYWYATPFKTGTETRISGYQFEAGVVHAAQFVRIDEASLWVAEQALQDLADAGRQALVGVTIHAQSLTSLAYRARILATIARLNPDLHRFRIIKIAGITQGFPRMYLKEVIGALRPRLPNIVLMASWDEPDIASLLHPGLSGIGLVVPGSGVMSGPTTAIPALMARARDAVRLSHGARMRFLVEGAVTKYLALKLAQTGVDNIASHAIWPVRSAAEGILKWPAHQLAAA